MSPFSRIGASIVIVALVSYGIAIITEQRLRRVTSRVRVFLAAGIVFDIVATAFMIMGSSKGAFTLHGLLGYSSLLGMLIDTWLIWRFSAAHQSDTPVPLGLHLYTRFAYAWWLTAFVTGGLLVAMR